MKITILGTGSEATLKPDYEGIKRMSPAVLISDAKSTILFDAGPDIKEELNGTMPDYIFISHEHPDHAAGKHHFQEDKVFTRHGYQVGNFTVTPFAVKHSKVAPAVGYKIINENIRIVYIPDYLGVYNMEHIKGTTVALLDGSSLVRDIVRDSTKTIGHRSMMNSLKMARDYAIPYVVFLHFGKVGASDDIAYRIESIAQEVGYQGDVFTPLDGDTYLFSDNSLLKEIKDIQNYNPTRLSTPVLLSDLKVVIAWYTNAKTPDIEELYYQIANELKRRSVELPKPTTPAAQEIYDRYITDNDKLATSILPNEDETNKDKGTDHNDLLARHQKLHNEVITNEVINAEIAIHAEAMKQSILLPIFADELEKAVADLVDKDKVVEVEVNKLLSEIIKQENGKWVLYSHDGTKKLGVFDTEKDALKREMQIQWFKYK